MIMEKGVRNVVDNPGLLMTIVDLSGVSIVQVKKCSILFSHRYGKKVQLCFYSHCDVTFMIISYIEHMVCCIS